MKIKKGLYIFCCLFLFFGISACKSSGSGSSTDDTSASSSSSSSDDNEDTSSWVDTDYSVSDDTDSSDFDYIVSIDFSANTVQIGSDPAQSITTAGTTIFSEDGLSITVALTTYGITLTSSVEELIDYKLSGSLSGTFTVESENAYQLSLDNVSITGASGPALNLKSAQKAFIVTEEDTTNTLTDTASRATDMTQKSAVWGKGPMIFSGEGMLTVTGNYKNAIANTDYIHIMSGAMEVNTDAKDGIRTVNAFIFDDGDLTINATGDTYGDESMGIKVVGDDDTTNGAGKGYIEINGGTIDITACSKGMTAHWDSDEDQGDNTSGNPDPYVAITGGTVSITTTSTTYTENGEGTPPEGIEGKSRVEISGGRVEINANEDGVNAGDAITISGGYVYVRSTGSDVDAFDSNGTITISGGVVVAVASNGGSMNTSFDYGERGSFAITGGTVVGIGPSVATPSRSTQPYTIQSSLSAYRNMAVRNSSSTTLFAYYIPQSFTRMLISSPNISSGTYYIYTGCTVTADETFNGLYLGNLSSSGGSYIRSFTPQ